MMDEASMQGHTAREWLRLFHETSMDSPRGRPGLEALEREYLARCRALAAAVALGRRCPPWDWTPENPDPRTEEERREDRRRNQELAGHRTGGIRIIKGG